MYVVVYIFSYYGQVSVDKSVVCTRVWGANPKIKWSGHLRPNKNEKPKAYEYKEVTFIFPLVFFVMTHFMRVEIVGFYSNLKSEVQVSLNPNSLIYKNYFST